MHSRTYLTPGSLNKNNRQVLIINPQESPNSCTCSLQLRSKRKEQEAECMECWPSSSLISASAGQCCTTSHTEEWLGLLRDREKNPVTPLEKPSADVKVWSYGWLLRWSFSFRSLEGVSFSYKAGASTRHVTDQLYPITLTGRFGWEKSDFVGLERYLW